VSGCVSEGSSRRPIIAVGVLEAGAVTVGCQGDRFEVLVILGTPDDGEGDGLKRSLPTVKPAKAKVPRARAMNRIVEDVIGDQYYVELRELRLRVREQKKEFQQERVVDILCLCAKCVLR
jgi:hypothetical protein